MEKTYKISESTLIELISAQLQLIALEQGGVDNWIWYGLSLSNYLSDNGNYETFEDLALDYIKKIILKQ